MAVPSRSRNRTACEVAGVPLSHPDRVLYPEQGLTKLDLARYYEKIADAILPHVAGRPLSVVRCPQGYDRDCFYQKHVNGTAPAPIRAVEILEARGSRRNYLMIEDLPGLVALVQLGVLEVHIWGAPARNVERPDRLVFDLDPDPELPWERVIEGARVVREGLELLGLRPWLKTTGGKGLHLVVPLDGRTGWDPVQAFARSFAESITRQAPERFVSSASQAQRKGKIYIDYLRNVRGATVVAPYSTRARAGAPVATPLRWDELERGLRADRFDIQSIPRRLRSLRRDPWSGFFDAAQSLKLAQR